MLKSWSIGILALLVSATAYAAPQRTEVDVTNPEGEVVGKIVLCNDCKDPSAGDAKKCADGALDGWRNGAPCGSCLLAANWGVLIEYAYDLQVAGTLVDPDGKPINDRFVKMFLPNGWSIRTRTLEDGSFRLMLGATAERKGTKPIVADVGTRVDTVSGEDAHFTLYLLPAGYKPCVDATPMKQAPSIDTDNL